MSRSAPLSFSFLVFALAFFSNHQRRISCIAERTRYPLLLLPLLLFPVPLSLYYSRRCRLSSSSMLLLLLMLFYCEPAKEEGEEEEGEKNAHCVLPCFVVVFCSRSVFCFLSCSSVVCSMSFSELGFLSFFSCFSSPATAMSANKHKLYLMQRFFCLHLIFWHCCCCCCCC